MSEFVGPPFNFFPGNKGVLFGAFSHHCASGLWSFACGFGSRGIHNKPQWRANAAQRRA